MSSTKKFKRVISLLLSAIMLLANFNLSIISYTVFAEPSLEGQGNIDEINDVENLQWVEDSAATILWTGVENANYYAVTVTVYRDDGITLIGATDTGTTATTLDVQQEIHNVIADGEYETVKVMATVVSQKKQDGVIVAQGKGVSTDMLNYSVQIVQIPTPTNVQLTDEYVAEFNYAIDEPEKNISSINILIYFNGNSYAIIHPTTVVWENGICKADIKASIPYLYQHYSFEDEVDVSYTVTLVSGNVMYSSSDSSELSNSVKYDGHLMNIPTPTNVQLTDEYVAEFNYSIDSPEENVSSINISIYFNGRSYALRHPTTVVWENGTCKADIKSSIAELYQYYGFSEDVDAAYTVTLAAKGNIYSNSNASSLSNSVKYNGNLIKIPAPTNIKLTKDFIAEFDCGIDEPEDNISSINILIYFNGSSYAIRYPTTVVWDNGTCKAVIKSSIAELYRHYGFEDEVDAAYTVTLIAKGNKYSSSNSSELSNPIKYNGKESVKSITIAPSSPLICKGNSYYLGKTIEPEDAYYETINWSSDAEDIVEVDSNGMITGVTVGSANVTATIDDVTATVPVTVYELQSNISEQEDLDNTDQQEIIDTAGDIIDDIANNDNPDLSNTDISDEDIEAIKDEIREGIERGDDFWIDFNWQRYGYDHYNLWDWDWFWNWLYGEIGKYDWHFGYGYDIGYEMHHKEPGGNDHHIGHITEFDKEYEFGFDIPDDMGKPADGYRRNYSIVRYHNGNYDIIPVEVDENGHFRAKSDRYSDFVLLYEDEKIQVPKVTAIETVTKEIEEPLAGNIPALAVHHKINDTDEDVQNSNIVRTVWYDSDGNVMADEAVFDDNKVYTVAVTIEAADGYCYNSDTVFYINDHFAETVVSSDGKTAVLTYNFVKKGDVDLNNKVNDADAAYLLKYLSGTVKELNKIQYQAALVNDDKDVNMLDVIAILDR